MKNSKVTTKAISVDLPVDVFRALKAKSKKAKRTVKNLIAAICTEEADDPRILETIDFPKKLADTLDQVCANLGIDMDTTVSVAMSEQIGRETGKPCNDQIKITVENVPVNVASGLMNLARGQGITVADVLGRFMQHATTTGADTLAAAQN